MLLHNLVLYMLVRCGYVFPCYLLLYGGYLCLCSHGLFGKRLPNRSEVLSQQEGAKHLVHGRRCSRSSANLLGVHGVLNTAGAGYMWISAQQQSSHSYRAAKKDASIEERSILAGAVCA